MAFLRKSSIVSSGSYFPLPVFFYSDLTYCFRTYTRAQRERTLYFIKIAKSRIFISKILPAEFNFELIRIPLKCFDIAKKQALY